MGEKAKNWLVVCVQSNREKKTYERLTALGFESFLPLQEEVHRWSDRNKKVQRVVIPMVVFARLNPSEYIQVLRLPSVNRFMVLRGESTPALIPDSQMERFRFMLDYSEQAVEMCTGHLQPGEQVKVIKGPLTGLSGELITMDGKSKVAVRINMLGAALVEIPVGFVESQTYG
ncbi:UpxY family transcription antiterminator [Bacteroides sp.]|uniref:UpxY family transcription antiterminator n=1 Tax=Bacteroides sp. TaxID=29523 RepID=UPI0025BD246F|nr:UpxY family transcription antiterminator [Bacteroides sp.]